MQHHLKIHLRKLYELKPYEFNNRRHSPEQIEQIANSIKEFGFVQPIVIDRAGIIVAGHGRYMAAAHLGLIEVPTVVLEELSAEQIRLYRILDNKLQNDSRWDYNNLELELGDLEDLGLKVGGWGLDKLLPTFEMPEPEVDDSPEKEKPTALVCCPACEHTFDPSLHKVKL